VRGCPFGRILFYGIECRFSRNGMRCWQSLVSNILRQLIGRFYEGFLAS
jgi:hypothetical protein